MPLPTPKKNQEEDSFMQDCMGDSTMNKDFKDQKQRVAVCYSQYKIRHKAKGETSWDDVRKGDSLNIL
jgi:hypothetical protein